MTDPVTSWVSDVVTDPGSNAVMFVDADAFDKLDAIGGLDALLATNRTIIITPEVYREIVTDAAVNISPAVQAAAHRRDYWLQSHSNAVTVETAPLDPSRQIFTGSDSGEQSILGAIVGVDEVIAAGVGIVALASRVRGLLRNMMSTAFVSAIRRRSATTALLFFLLLGVFVRPPANAALLLGGFGPICVRVFDLAEDWKMQERDDIAERVSGVVRVKLRDIDPARVVRARPDCIKVDQPGYDHQLMLNLSIKRQTVKVGDRDWNLVIAGGVSVDGLFRDRALQPRVILQEDSVSDDRIVDALVRFVDDTIVAALRR
jgi:hypothetical protein